MEEKTSIKELIFNKHRYSTTKKALGFIVLIILIALTTNEKFENALVVTCYLHRQHFLSL